MSGSFSYERTLRNPISRAAMRATLGAASLRSWRATMLLNALYSTPWEFPAWMQTPIKVLQWTLAGFFFTAAFMFWRSCLETAMTSTADVWLAMWANFP